MKNEQKSPYQPWSLPSSPRTHDIINKRGTALNFALAGNPAGRDKGNAENHIKSSEGDHADADGTNKNGCQPKIYFNLHVEFCKFTILPWTLSAFENFSLNLYLETKSFYCQNLYYDFKDQDIVCSIIIFGYCELGFLRTNNQQKNFYHGY